MPPAGACLSLSAVNAASTMSARIATKGLVAGSLALLTPTEPPLLLLVVIPLGRRWGQEKGRGRGVAGLPPD
jgi:hypothetical protein